MNALFFLDSSTVNQIAQVNEMLNNDDSNKKMTIQILL